MRFAFFEASTNELSQFDGFRDFSTDRAIHDEGGHHIKAYRTETACKRMKRTLSKERF